MKIENFFRPLFGVVCLCALTLSVVSCSQGPTSPLEEKQTLNKIRPLPRQSDDEAPARRSLAKGFFTDSQLIAFINQNPPMASGVLKGILLIESPLSSPVLMAVVNRPTKMEAEDLVAVFIASRPLPVEVEQAIQTTALLGGGDLQTVMEAQAGFTTAFLGTTVSKWMTKKLGGDLWHGGHKLGFPNNALPQDAAAFITISPSDYVEVEFGPNGTFNKPVTVTLSYKNVNLNGVSETALTLAWYDPITQQWISAGGVVDTVKKTITAQVTHFTKYTISAT